VDEDSSGAYSQKGGVPSRPYTQALIEIFIVQERPRVKKTTGIINTASGLTAVMMDA
jgi:hypothetical protein